MVYILYFWLRIARKNTMVECHFYNFTKLFLKDVNKDIIYCNKNNWERRTFCSLSFDVSPTACSYCKPLDFNVNVLRRYVTGTGRGSLCLLRVPLSQNHCFMEVKLSVFRAHWVSVIALWRPHVNNQFRTSLRDTKILTMSLLSVAEKFIERLETKLADVDPSLVGQHVRPLKNNNFKPCTAQILTTFRVITLII